MIPWNKLPKDMQKAILVMITLYGGSATAACRPPGPVICDPAPPPTTSPVPPVTPIICDPAPPPAITVPSMASPTPTLTLTPTATPTATPTVGPPATPIICDPAPPPSVTPMIFDPAPAPSSLREAPSDVTFATLPLAEIRSVDIERTKALTFAARTPWPAARLRWTASGGTLVQDGQTVVWQPPAEPGRYLLQVVADWGQVGLAVDALVLEVAGDGRVVNA